jgi:hypothetical protein
MSAAAAKDCQGPGSPLPSSSPGPAPARDPQARRLFKLWQWFWCCAAFGVLFALSLPALLFSSFPAAYDACTASQTDYYDFQDREFECVLSFPPSFFCSPLRSVFLLP